MWGLVWVLTVVLVTSPGWDHPPLSPPHPTLYTAPHIHHLDTTLIYLHSVIPPHAGDRTVILNVEIFCSAETLSSILNRNFKYIFKMKKCQVLSSSAAVPPNCTPENKWNNKRLLKIRDQRILCWLSLLSLVHSRISSCVCSSIHYCYYSPSQDPDQDRSMGQQGYKINTPGPMAGKSRSTIVSIQPMVPALQLCSQIGVGLKLFGLYYGH